MMALPLLAGCGQKCCDQSCKLKIKVKTEKTVTTTVLREPNALAALAQADLAARRERVRQDNAIETMRKIDRLGAGAYEIRMKREGENEEVFRATVEHPDRNTPIWLLAASYKEGHGLTLRTSPWTSED